MKIKMKLKGLCCANCSAKIEEKTAKLPGVESAVLSFLTGKLIVEAADDRAELLRQQIREIIRKIEPDVVVEDV